MYYIISSMITLALIGLGKWGANFLKTIERMKNCKIKYIAATSKTTLSKFSDNYIKTTDYKDFFRFSDIDGIIIATPGSTHYKISKDCTSHGFYVLVEKPLTATYQDALSLKKLFQNKKSKIMVGHIYLYNPAFITMKSFIPEIGKLRYMTFKLYNFGPFRDDLSVLWELGPHGIATCIDLLKDSPVEVSALGTKTLRPNTNLYDKVTLKLKFKQEVNCFLEFGWLYPIRKREITLFGSKSTIMFDDLAEEKISIFKNLGPIVGKKVTGQQTIIKHPSYDTQTPLESEINAFVKFIKSHKQPIADLDQAIEIAAIIHAAEKSLNEGKVVKLDDIYSKV